MIPLVFLALVSLASLGISLSMSPSWSLAFPGAAAAAAWSCPPAAMLAGAYEGVRGAKANLPLAWASLGRNPWRELLPKAMAGALSVALLSVIAAAWISPLGIRVIIGKINASVTMRPGKVVRVGPDLWIAELPGRRVLGAGRDREKGAILLRGKRDDANVIGPGMAATTTEIMAFRSLSLPSHPSPIVRTPSSAKPGLTTKRIIVGLATLFSTLAGFVVGLSRRSYVAPMAGAALLATVSFLAVSPWARIAIPVPLMLATTLFIKNVSFKQGRTHVSFFPCSFAS